MAALHYALDLHLAYLLYQEDSLAVPGLGTFQVRRYGAEIQLPAGLLLPPARRVSFVPGTPTASANLLAHLETYEGLDTATALEAVRTSVAVWVQILERGDRLNLQGIGSLRKLDQAWVFKASLEANFLAESYGLPMFRMDVLEAAQHQQPEASVRTAPRISSWQAAAVVAGALGLAAVGGSKDDLRGMMQSASVRTEVAAWWLQQRGQVAEFAREGAAWFTNLGSQTLAERTEDLDEETNVPLEDQTLAHDGNLDAEVQQPVSPAPVQPEPEPEVAMKPAKTTKSAKVASSRGRYALVVGAFAEARNAERLVLQLRQSGYPAELLDASVGLNKVALRTFADEDSARKAKAELKSDFPAIWIYHE